MSDQPTSIHFEVALLPAGWASDVRVTISAGRIDRVETGTKADVFDERHAIGIPGLPNLHSHAFQRGMAGLAERRGAAGTGASDSFWTWRETMYRFVERVGPEEVRAIAAMAYLEMLETGFTRVAEFHYLHHDIDGSPYENPAEMAAALGEAASETGIGFTLLPVFYAHGGFGSQRAGTGQRRFINDIDRFACLREATQRTVSTLPDAVVGIAPHSLRACSAEQLDNLSQMVGSEDPIHIHIAEQVKEVEDCLAWSGARPVEWLLDNAPVDRRWCLVHATHMTAVEAARAARSGAVAGLCPITEANLGDGLFPADAFLTAGGGYGLGSDSNVLIDAAEEMRLLEYGQRLFGRGRNRLANARYQSAGAAIFHASLAGGAQACGVQAGLAQGNAADIVSLDGEHPSLIARDHDRLLDGWIFGGRGGAIDSVWRLGVECVRAGRHVARDAVLRRYGNTLRALLDW